MQGTTRDRARWRQLLVDGVLGLLVAWLLTVAARVNQQPPGRQPGGPPEEPYGPPWGPGGWDENSFAAIPWQPWMVALAVGIGAAVAVRRVFPRVSFLAVVVLTGTYLTLGGPIPPTLLAPALVVFVLGSRRPAREFWIPLVLVAVMVWTAFWSQPWLGLADPTLYMAVVLGLAVTMVPGMAAMIRSDRRSTAERQRHEELQRVAYEERLRVARDIHDVVGHSLSMISLQSGVALHVLERNPEQARRSLQAIRDASRDSLAELRQTLGVFRAHDSEPQPLAPSPRLSDLDALTDGVRAVGREVVITREGPVDDAPARVQTAVYRLVQEALTNAIRHSRASTIRVVITAGEAGFTLDVTDDGEPITAPVREGNGLRGARERVAALGGTLRIEPATDGGLALHAHFPPGEDDT
ncbi:sensor histidine kinase [Propionibacteriaceae bacterium Y2011]